MQRRALFLLLAVVILAAVPLAHAAAQPLIPPPFTLDASAAMLVDMGTGTVIFEKNADQPLPVASVTKTMTLMLVLDAMEDGRLAPDQAVSVSKNAAATEGSEAFLDAGASYAANDLIKSVIVASANDSCVALAEHLYGSEKAFVDKMNERARQMDLKNTNFANTTGLPVSGGTSSRMSARDIATLSRSLAIRPGYQEFSKVWLTEITHKNGRKTELVNTNRLIRFFDGADGVKTGSTAEAGYCVSASATQGGMSMLAIVLGSKTSKDRFDLASRMLKYGFDHYQMQSHVKTGDIVKKDVPVKQAGNTTVDLVAGNGASTLGKKGSETQATLTLDVPDTLKAPLRKDQAVGRLTVTVGGEEIAVIPVYPSLDIGLPGVYESLLRILDHWH